MEIFGNLPKDPLIGFFLNLYIGNAINYDIRYNSTSGGLVTSLLVFAIDNDIIDGVLVTKMSDEDPFTPEVFLAKNADEIIEASKSKYCPVSLNAALKTILNSKGRYAVVGLPCHIHGIRKAEIVNRNLREKIILHIGLFCSHTPNFHATEIFLKRLKLDKKEIMTFDYRGEGWPGSMKIKIKNDEILVQLPDYWNFMGKDFFTPRRCLLCCDNLNEIADLSIGDAWLEEYKDDSVGKSIFISRTPLAEDLINKAVFNDVIEIEKTTSEKVKISQLDIIYLKKKSLKARMKIFNNAPEFKTDLLSPSYSDYSLSIFLYLTHLLSQNSFTLKLIEKSPNKLITLYFMLYNKIFAKKLNGWLDKCLQNK